MSDAVCTLVDIQEALKPGFHASGTTGSSRSDVAMYCADKLIEHGVTVIIFDATQDRQKRSNIERHITLNTSTAPDVPEQSTVYHISLLTPLQQHKLVEDFNKKLFNYKLQKLDRKWCFFNYAESHLCLRQGCVPKYAMPNSVCLLSQGRNYEIGFAVITQLQPYFIKKGYDTREVLARARMSLYTVRDGKLREEKP